MICVTVTFKIKILIILMTPNAALRFSEQGCRWRQSQGKNRPMKSMRKRA